MDAPLVLAMDAHKIERVIENLISNAIKFSPQKAAITVGIKQQLSEVIISVTDEGIGIPAP